ncbi:KAP family P-loop NTPase fold protein [Pantoea ananatis]|uniref:KAP family P-loop NTPase fold protein n=1 Tax=Pantoea ananas TaxID=553 RepID=UPI001C890258|nr:P-loop NTPase fold protein [Pantoea ananatis]QZE31406.1 KAP family NTPase [Pantoea ananatis]
MSTLPELAFKWSEPHELFPEDNMSRADHARHLTNFLAEKGKEANYVLNLDARWGTGKTYFLKRWAHEIKDRYPCVYIDAWSSDHSSDPLLSVVSEIRKTLHELHNISELEVKLFEGVAKAVKATLPAVIKGLLKGQLKKLSGLDADEWNDFINADDIAETGAKLVEEAIDAHNEASVGVGNIKKSIQNWLQSAVDKTDYINPLFIFIDELDRCRPTYAIEMLETIKHIFDMKNVVFIVATDKEQLEHSIKAVYGSGFNSRLYLDRFFSRSVTLTNPSRYEFIKRKVTNSSIFLSYISNDANFAFLVNENRFEDTVEVLTGIADGFDWPLRTVNLWLDRLEAAITMSNIELEMMMLSFMMALETDDSDWLNLYLSGYHIFRTAHNAAEKKLKFSTFFIITPWKFGLMKDTLNRDGCHDFSDYFEKIHRPQISFLDFFMHRLNTLKSGNFDQSNEMTQAYRELTSARGMRKQQFGENNFKSEFDMPAMYIYSNFHLERKITLNHYIEICKYASLMS